MPYPVYANEDDVMNYLGLTDNSSLPEDLDRKLKRASELIYYVTFGNIKLNVQSHEDAVRQAACAQIEYWMQASEVSAITGQNVNSFSLGDLSMNFEDKGGNSNQAKQIAPRAKDYLNMEGLMYRGIGW